MGRKSKIKFFIRSIILVIVIVISIINPNIFNIVLNYDIISPIKIYHLFWLLLLIEMLIILIPKFNKFSYCGKHLSKHYIEERNYNKENLKVYTKKNYIRALRALCSWVMLNVIIFFVYYNLNLPTGFIYLLFIFYYWADMFCVNIWCPFHKIIVRNKCCNECRIYNWAHIMYCTPFIFIANFWTYSLFAVSLIIFLQWEYQNLRHPERFSAISNKSLRCDVCSHDCRYNKNKKIN